MRWFRVTLGSLPSGLLFISLLVGILVLSALIYLRAVKFQRFLEPALAISVPRSEFSRLFNGALVREFGTAEVKGLYVRTSSMVIDEDAVFTRQGRMHGEGHILLRRIARVFREVMRDERMRPDVGSVMILMRYYEHAPSQLDSEAREMVQRRAWRMLEILFESEPELRAKYGHLFLSAAVPGAGRQSGSGVIEVRIIPSDHTLIDFLQKMEKYAR